MFEVSFKTVMDAYPALIRLGAMPLSLRASRRVAAVLRVARVEVEGHEASRNSLLQRLGTPTDKENEFFLSPEILPEWNRQLAEALAEITAFPCEKIIENDVPDDFLLTPIESMAFDHFLVEAHHV